MLLGQKVSVTGCGQVEEVSDRQGNSGEIWRYPISHNTWREKHAHNKRDLVSLPEKSVLKYPFMICTPKWMNWLCTLNGLPQSVQWPKH